MSRNIKDMRTARTPTLPIDPFKTYLEVHQDNLASGLKSTGASSNEILSSGPGAVTVTDNYEALVTDMIIYANMTNKSVTMNASKQIGSSVKIWKISDYDGDAVTVLPGSGITIEGLSELKLYGKYSFVELERISATVFAINAIDDNYTITPTISFGASSTGITYTYQAGDVRVVKGRAYTNGRITLSSKGTATGALAIVLGAAPIHKPYGVNRVSGNIYMYGVTYTGQYGCFMSAGNSTLTVGYVTEAGAQTAIGDTNCSNTMTIIFAIEYPT